MPVTIYAHPLFIKHETPPSHPESPARYETLLTALSPFPQITPEPRPIEDLILKAHTLSHLAFLKESTIEDEITCIDGKDIFLSTYSIDSAKQAVINICQAITDLKDGRIEHAFCLSRPPGHHAEANKAMGFCLFNTVFLGALHAKESGFTRVAILDFDVHHGNGTDTMIRAHEEENLFFISTHQSPLYPWTGDAETSTSKILNYPLAPDTGSTEMRTLYTEKIFPALKDFAPDILLLSAGFDAHEADPHGGLNWTTDDYRWLGEQLKPYKTVSTLEGGYNLPALRDSVLAFIEGVG